MYVGAPGLDLPEFTPSGELRWLWAKLGDAESAATRAAVETRIKVFRIGNSIALGFPPIGQQKRAPAVPDGAAPLNFEY
jgi:hypothetical protein